MTVTSGLLLILCVCLSSVRFNLQAFELGTSSIWLVYIVADNRAAFIATTDAANYITCNFATSSMPDLVFTGRLRNAFFQVRLSMPFDKFVLQYIYCVLSVDTFRSPCEFSLRSGSYR